MPLRAAAVHAPLCSGSDELQMVEHTEKREPQRRHRRLSAVMTGGGGLIGWGGRVQGRDLAAAANGS